LANLEYTHNRLKSIISESDIYYLFNYALSRRHLHRLGHAAIALAHWYQNYHLCCWPYLFDWYIPHARPHYHRPIV